MLWSEFGLQTKVIPLIHPILLGTNILTGLCDNSAGTSLEQQQNTATLCSGLK